MEKAGTPWVIFLCLASFVLCLMLSANGGEEINRTYRPDVTGEVFFPSPAYPHVLPAMD